MAQFTYKLQEGESDQGWSSIAQPFSVRPPEKSYAPIKFGLGIGAISLLGKLPVGDKRGWDYINHAARVLEEYSPGRILRTFQVSHMLSPLEAASSTYKYFGPEQISNLRKTTIGSSWLENFSKLTGVQTSSLSEGFRFENGQIKEGLAGNKVLLHHAGVVNRTTTSSPKFQEAYSRSLFGGPRPLEVKTFSDPIEFIDKAGRRRKEIFTFIGGQTKLQSKYRFLAGYGTMLSERINQLARAPFELPVISTAISKIPLIRSLRLDVTPSSGLKTLAKITGKLGILAPMAYLAYREADYYARKSELLDETVLDEGISVGVGTLWAKSQMLISQAADVFGLHDYRKKQEEIATGSTNLSTLAAFPILGAWAGLTKGYIDSVAKQIKYRRSGLSLSQASSAVQAEEIFTKFNIAGEKVPESAIKSLDKSTLFSIESKVQDKLSGKFGSFLRKTRSFQEGGTLLGRALKGLGIITPKRLKWIAGAAAGVGLIAPFIPGALIPSNTPEELKDLYSGETKEAIRKGRWWELGRSPYEGKNIDRFQEHWLPRMKARGKEKAIWGEDAPSPMKRWWIENFTYDLERKHYRDRPYPISGVAFEDVPFFGPILAATIGRVFKPALLMHTEEWQKEIGNGTEAVSPFAKYNEEVLPGDIKPSQPVSPYAAEGTIGKQIYNLTEMIGLPGFVGTSIKESITGRADTFDENMHLESSVRMYGSEREYWDKDLGGGLGTTELIRRLYPHRRRQIELYNPIRNTMPDWMPGPGEKSPDFQHGDPFVKIKEGEMRLPGEGYASLYPELKGVDPEDYSAIHRFAILSDVAPYTRQFGVAKLQIQAQLKNGKLSLEEINRYKKLSEELELKKVKREFHEYKWKERKYTPMEKVLAEANEREKLNKDSSWFDQTIGSYWETLTHGAETPIEFLTPVSPASKLIHQRTAVEDYKKNQIYGTENAFWSRPIRDFLKPFSTSLANNLGWEGIPEAVQEKRDTEEYFDLLKYVKFTKLKESAEKQKDDKKIKEYEKKRRQTLFGINPYTSNFSYIFRSLPRRERDYLESFMEADMSDRVRIMKMIPENEKALMMGRWELKDAKDMQEAIDKNLLTEDQVNRAKVLQDQLFEKQSAEGHPKTKDLWVEYIETRSPGESYPDWYRRVKLLPKKLKGHALPGPDWVGWNPSVDLEDVKLKIILQEGKNMYDYDLWPGQLRKVARRPSIHEAAETLPDPIDDEEEMRGRINEVLSANGISTSHLSLSKIHGMSSNVVDLKIEENRFSNTYKTMKKYNDD